MQAHAGTGDKRKSAHVGTLIVGAHNGECVCVCARFYYKFLRRGVLAHVAMNLHGCHDSTFVLFLFCLPVVSLTFGLNCDQNTEVPVIKARLPARVSLLVIGSFVLVCLVWRLFCSLFSSPRPSRVRSRPFQPSQMSCSADHVSVPYLLRPSRVKKAGTLRQPKFGSVTIERSRRVKTLFSFACTQYRSNGLLFRQELPAGHFRLQSLYLSLGSA